MNAYSMVAAVDSTPHDELVLGHMVLVKRIAYHLAARLPASVEIDDLEQAGMIGLIEAANNFDASHGASFETYAGIRIRGAMIDDIRKHDWTPRSVHHKYRQISDAINAIEAEQGRAAEPAEVATRLKISIDEYHKILNDSASSRLFSLDDCQGDPTLVRQSHALASETPDEVLSRTQFAGQLSAAIEKLPERERLVLSLYYEQDLNLKEIGEVLEVSESRVCQIHAQAVTRLRSVTENW
ncbi:MAG TPA: RNA polymerase sigma factor FliA [Woeseiaceae bacterium]|nr:RNA polymerase sigma factor FliA [Woeseiaceae bacterium]